MIAPSKGILEKQGDVSDATLTWSKTFVEFFEPKKIEPWMLSVTMSCQHFGNDEFRKNEPYFLSENKKDIESALKFLYPYA